MKHIIQHLLKILNSGRLNFFFFLLVIFTLPISRQLFTIALWPWLFTWIIEGRFREKFSLINFKENRSSLFFLPALFILMLISIFWSSDNANGLNQLGIQSSLIIFPVFISFASDIYRKKESLRRIFIAFVSGAIFISIFLLVKALLYSISIKNGGIFFDHSINGWESVFFFSTFSYLIHPTYLGLMILFAASICILDIKTEICFRKRIPLKIIISLFLYLIIFFISSRAVIIASIILAIWLIFKLLYGKKFLIPVAVLLLVIAFLLLSMHPRITRFIESNGDIDKGSIEKLDIRIRIWKSSFTLIKENPLSGVGAGDVKNELGKIYKDNNYVFASTYNCHNQYIEQWLSAGILSLILLICCLLIPFINTASFNKEYYLSFIMLISFIFLFESILCRFWGVAFFSIFYTLLSRNNISNSGLDPSPEYSGSG